MSSTYTAAYTASMDDADAFWLDAARALHWDAAPATGWTDGAGWFADGVMNTCFNAVDRHVEAGRGDQDALIYESTATGVTEYFTYAQLLDHVARTAGMLSGLGVARATASSSICR